MPTQLHRGRVVDAVQLLLTFAKQEGFETQPVLVVLDELRDMAREKLEGCELSHDLMLKEQKLTIDDHFEQCTCLCSFCEAEHERCRLVLAKKEKERKE
jgi:hypothetical protein